MTTPEKDNNNDINQEPSIGCAGAVLIVTLGLVGNIMHGNTKHDAPPPGPFSTYDDSWGLETLPQPIVGVGWENHTVPTSR